MIKGRDYKSNHNIMETSLFELSPALLPAIPAILAMIQGVKGMFNIPSKYAPGLAILLGMAAVWLFGHEWEAIVIQGILVGLAASGLYSGGKTSINTLRGE